MKHEAAALTGALLAKKGDAIPSRLFAVPSPSATPRPVSPRAESPSPPPGPRRRLTLRLDHDRHLRLKLAAAHLGLSLQDVIIAALDDHLSRTAPCACLKGDQP
jgi:hypothetical protein